MAKKPIKDKVWESLFNQYNILPQINQHGFYNIASITINKLQQARLMTKFDCSADLPEIFKKNKLTIQPTSRGGYIIGKFKSYHKLPKQYNRKIERCNFPNFIKTVSPDPKNSEAADILCAYHGGLFNKVMGEEAVLTIMGRMGTGVFDYQIQQKNLPRHTISVNKAQCEIDGGFESISALGLVEAKNKITDDFLIRQLYYPYRLWLGKTKKLITPIFMTHFEGVFSFYKFKFNNYQLYNSLALQGSYHFQFGTIGITMKDLVQIFNTTIILPEPLGIPFPQADSIERLIDLLRQFKSKGGSLNTDEITDLQGFSKRQANYYADAGCYLGLIGKPQTTIYQLSQVGQKMLAMRQRRRYLELVRLILCHSVFYDAFQIYLNNGTLPDKNTVANLIQGVDGSLSNYTCKRRASTVLRWLGWVLELLDR